MIFFTLENQNDRTKVERLYYSYREVMYRVAYNILKDKHLAEDAVQQAFIKIFDHLHKIDENNYHKTQGFLVIICRNVSYEIYRQNKNMQLSFLEENENTYIDTSVQPIDLVIHEERLRYLINRIKEMKPIYSDVMLLKYAHGLSTDEIATLLEITTDTVRKRLERARKMLSNFLMEEELI